MYERLVDGDLWSLRYRIDRGVWERQGPFPNRLRWFPAASDVRTAQGTTDDLINRYYAMDVDTSVTDMTPRGMDHRSALGLVRDVLRQTEAARAMVQSRCNPHDREAILMVEALGMVVGLLDRWRP
jgi:hypothetical protein